MREHKYWAVIWGGNARFGWKHEFARTAAAQAYGSYYSDMEIIDLGTRKQEAFKAFDKLIKDRKLTAH